MTAEQLFTRHPDNPILTAAQWPYPVNTVFNAAALVQGGETALLATTQSAKGRADLDFFPLTVDYQEKGYAAGQIPGNFFRREGRPSEAETLLCRLVDRPLRPRAGARSLRPRFRRSMSPSTGESTSLAVPRRFASLREPASLGPN